MNRFQKKSKILCVLLCLIFSTTMFAQLPSVVNFQKVSVSNLSDLKAALQKSENTYITLTKSIDPDDPNIKISDLRYFSDQKSDTIDWCYWAETPAGYYKYLDLNGKKFVLKLKTKDVEQACMIYNNGHLTIADNSGSKGEMRFDDYMYDEMNHIPIRSLIYTSANSSVTVNGGYLNAGRHKYDWVYTPGIWDNYAFMLYREATKYGYFLKHETVSKGNFPTITRLIGGSCIVTAGGSVVINGGELSANGGQFDAPYYYQSKTRAPGGCITYDHINAPYFPYIVINGGKFTADLGARAIAAYTNSVSEVSDNTYINNGEFDFKATEKNDPVIIPKKYRGSIFGWRFIEIRNYTGLPYSSFRTGNIVDAETGKIADKIANEYIVPNRWGTMGKITMRKAYPTNFTDQTFTVQNNKIVGENKIESFFDVLPKVYMMPDVTSIINTGTRTDLDIKVSLYIDNNKSVPLATTWLKKGDDVNKFIQTQIDKGVFDPKNYTEKGKMQIISALRSRVYDVAGNEVCELYTSTDYREISFNMQTVHEHKYTSSEVIIKKPSCTEVGVKQLHCSCGAFVEQAIPMTAHNYCEDYFYTEKIHWMVCLNCGKEYEPVLDDGEYYKKTHTWNSILIKRGQHVCIVCGYNKEACHPENIDKQGDMCRDDDYHWWNCPTHADAASCPHKGMIDYAPHEHFVVDDADYKERVKSLGTGYNYVPGDCQNGWFCKNEECNAFFHKSEVPHIMVKASETESTCAKQGEITYKCYFDGRYNLNNMQIHCSEKKVVKKDLLAHNYVYRADLSINPTCSKQGKQVYVCTGCNAKNEVPVSALEHEYEYHPEIAATCQGEGVKAYYSCTKCDDLMLTQGGAPVSSSQLVIPKNESNHASVRYMLKDNNTHVHVCLACNKETGWSGSHDYETNADGVTYCPGCNAHFSTISTTEGEGYATYIGDFDADVPEGAKFYTVSKVDADNSVVLVEVDHITAGVPYLVYSESKADIRLSGMQGINKGLEDTEEAQYVFTEGLLTGYLKTTATDAGVYMFKTVNGVPGFYKNETSDFANPTTCSLSFLSETPVVYILAADGVKTPQLLDTNKAQRIYDVLGRQLPEAKKGVNIINGKKVMK